MSAVPARRGPLQRMRGWWGSRSGAAPSGTFIGRHSWPMGSVLRGGMGSLSRLRISTRGTGEPSVPAGSSSTSASQPVSGCLTGARLLKVSDAPAYPFITGPRDTRT